MKTLYIVPPSFEELGRRVTGTEERIAKRLRNAPEGKGFLEKEKAVHHKIVNEDIDTAYQNLRAQILNFGI